MYNHFQLNSTSRSQSHLDTFRFLHYEKQDRHEPPPVHEKERKKKEKPIHSSVEFYNVEGTKIRDILR